MIAFSVWLLVVMHYFRPSLAHCPVTRILLKSLSGI